jgi:hypothetical protein
LRIADLLGIADWVAPVDCGLISDLPDWRLNHQSSINRNLPITSPQSIHNPPITNPQSIHNPPITNPQSIRNPPITNPQSIRNPPIANPQSIRNQPAPANHQSSINPQSAILNPQFIRRFV